MIHRFVTFCTILFPQAVTHPSRWSEESQVSSLPFPSQKELLAVGAAAWNLVGTNLVLLQQEPELPAAAVSRITAAACGKQELCKTAFALGLDKVLVRSKSGAPIQSPKLYKVRMQHPVGLQNAELFIYAGRGIAALPVGNRVPLSTKCYLSS